MMLQLTLRWIKRNEEVPQDAQELASEKIFILNRNFLKLVRTSY